MGKNYQLEAEADQEWPSPGIAMGLHVIPRDLLVDFHVNEGSFSHSRISVLVPGDMNRASMVLVIHQSHLGVY